MNTKAMKPETLVDRLGDIQTQIKELKEAEAELKEELKIRDITEVTGDNFRFLRTDITRNSVDWKGITAEYEIPANVIESYTTRTEQTRITVKPV